MSALCKKFSIQKHASGSSVSCRREKQLREYMNFEPMVDLNL